MVTTLLSLSPLVLLVGYAVIQWRALRWMRGACRLAAIPPGAVVVAAAAVFFLGLSETSLRGAIWLAAAVPLASLYLLALWTLYRNRDLTQTG